MLFSGGYLRAGVCVPGGASSAVLAVRACDSSGVVVNK